MNTRTPPALEQDLSESNLIFVHSKLDDMGLTMAEWRVFGHLSRRAGAGLAWPGIDSMAFWCRANKATVIAAVKGLEFMGMVTATRVSGMTTRYRITKPSTWKVRAAWVTKVEEFDATQQQMGSNGVARPGTVPNEVTPPTVPNEVTLPCQKRERHRAKRGNERFSTEGSPIKEKTPTGSGRPPGGVVPVNFGSPEPEEPVVIGTLALAPEPESVPKPEPEAQVAPRTSPEPVEVTGATPVPAESVVTPPPKPKGKTKPPLDPRFIPLIAAWKEERNKVRKYKCVITDHDGQELKRFLVAYPEITLDEVLAVARMAWAKHVTKEDRYWTCRRHSGEMHTFLKWYQKIQDELMGSSDVLPTEWNRTKRKDSIFDNMERQIEQGKQQQQKAKP